MAHFNAAVIVPTLALGNLGAHLDELLAPYADNGPVEPYFTTDTYDATYELSNARKYLRNRAKSLTDLELLKLWTGDRWSRNAEGTLGHWSTDNPHMGRRPPHLPLDGRSARRGAGAVPSG